MTKVIFYQNWRGYFYRMANDIFTKPVNEIVKADFRTADVFDRLGISYCCGGNTALARACELRSLDPLRVSEELATASLDLRLPSNLRFGNWSQEFLCAYIRNIHHACLLESIPLIDSQLRHFAHAHVNKMPYLADLLKNFELLAERLLEQTLYENETVLPYICRLDAAIRSNETFGPLFVRTLRKPMAKSPDTEQAIHLFEKMRDLTGGYRLPEKCCTTHRVLYQKLEEMDRDFVFHTRLEQTILFPRAIEAEQQLLRQ